MMLRAFRRVAVGLFALLAVVFSGAVVLYVISGGHYSLWDTVYFSLITVATVGFWELPNMQAHYGARAVTAVLILFGVGAIAFFESTVTALLIENIIGKLFRRRRMQNRISALNDHLVVAGVGRTGQYVTQELLSAEQPFVAIDRNEEVLEKLNLECGGKLLYVVGDATEDEVLMQAGVDRARGVVSALTDDRDNLFVTLSARSLNPKARIVSKVVVAENEAKIAKAGANAAVCPQRIGGLRLVSELVRPNVTEFLDQMLRITGKHLRFDEVPVPDCSGYAGRTLREVPIREKTSLLVVAMRLADGSYVYNPSSEQPLTAGSRLIVIGDSRGVKKLGHLLASE
jgi:voltage-gated potassium channel